LHCSLLSIVRTHPVMRQAESVMTVPRFGVMPWIQVDLLLQRRRWPGWTCCCAFCRLPCSSRSSRSS